MQASYDAVAGRYTKEVADELDGKPLDRALLTAFAELAAAVGDREPAGKPGLPRVWDVGCGPGHVTRYLAGLGAQAVGIDLSPGMVELARRRSPGLDFRVGDLRALEVDDAAWGGIVALYSIIHLPPAELPAALTELHRVLRPGGLLLLAFHAGNEQVHVDDWFGQAVSFDGFFLEPAGVEGELVAAGFEVDARLERRPYPREYQSQRAYLLARKPA
jgi:SAM-dependent methyltransferase